MVNTTTQPQTHRRRGRPSKADAANAETRELLLRAGVELLTEQGFSSTGIDQILKRVGVPKGSFYHYYKSKEAFGAALIERYHQYFSRKLSKHFCNESLTPLSRVKAFIADAEVGIERFEFSRGCLVGNLGQEMGTLPEAFRTQLCAVFGTWQTQLAVCFEAAKKSGELSVSSDSAELAAFFWIGWEGAVMRAKLERSLKPIQTFATYFFASVVSR